MDIATVLHGHLHRHPSILVDRVVDHEPGRRLVAVKNVTVGEEYFPGHFPGQPVLPGVLMIEMMTQAAALLIVGDDPTTGRCAWLRGVDRAKFRRQVIPGDQLRLEVAVKRTRHPVTVVRCIASVDGRVAAEADLLLAVREATVRVHPTAIVHEGARLGEGTEIGPFAIIGPHVTLGRRCRVGASAVIDGLTTIGDDNQFYPSVSIGLIPQDMKFRGEQTRLVIGRDNVFREFVTVHCGTAGGGGLTEIGDHNFFMAYAHVAHDCRVGQHTIFANAATLAGHVLVDDYATVGAFSAVHQFCRVGRHGFLGGFSVAVQDVLPFSKTVGNRARTYGINRIGLVRRGFSPETILSLKRAYRLLLRHNTTRAIERIEADPSLQCPEVEYLVEFIRTARRGVSLKRGLPRVEAVAPED